MYTYIFIAPHIHRHLSPYTCSRTIYACKNTICIILYTYIFIAPHIRRHLSPYICSRVKKKGGGTIVYEYHV